MIENNADTLGEFPVSSPAETRDTAAIELSAHFHAERWADDSILEPEIDVAEPEPAEQISDDEELDSAAQSDALHAATDPIASYPQDIGSVPLFSCDQEIK